MLLLSETAGFTLSLPGIAGLIVGVGITADSFIVYFERIRDEMRDGKSMRVAVESRLAPGPEHLPGRRRRLAARRGRALHLRDRRGAGFAFALGLSTLIDLAVFFWFTKPDGVVAGAVHVLQQRPQLSGLSAETLGMDDHADRLRVAAPLARRGRTA